MESQKPKIAMYVKRPFGEKLNASCLLYTSDAADE